MSLLSIEWVSMMRSSNGSFYATRDTLVSLSIEAIKPDASRTIQMCVLSFMFWSPV